MYNFFKKSLCNAIYKFILFSSKLSFSLFNLLELARCGISRAARNLCVHGEGDGHQVGL